MKEQLSATGSLLLASSEQFEKEVPFIGICIGWQCQIDEYWLIAKS